MSKHRAWSWRHAILKSNLPPTTRHVLLTISCYMNELGAGCYPTVKDLEEATGLTDRAIVKHIGIAAELGWLSVKKHGFRGQRWKNNEYFAKWPDLVETLEQPAPKVRKTRAKKAVEGEAAPVENTEPTLFWNTGNHGEGNEPRSLPQAGGTGDDFGVEVVNLKTKGSESNSAEVVNHVPPILPDSFHHSSTSARAPTRESADEKERGGDFGFSGFWEAWPEALRPDHRSFVERLFLALSEDDRRKAIGCASHYRRAVALRKGHPKMVHFLKDRLFEEFHDAPEIDRDGDFVIGPGRPEWPLWLEHVRARFGEPAAESMMKTGRFVGKERWPAPPGAAASQSA